tara:strand:+ start:207 stop:593 length:387 start_codon:yes stop_codon:yes gene_type:complete
MSKKKLAKKLDAVFSRYIRWYYADHTGYVECYTCGVQKPVKEMQCGHFQSRRHYATRWKEDNCRPQCVKCNMFEQGQQYIFGQKLISDLGEEAVDDLIKLSRTTIKTTEEEYKVLIDYYTLKLKELTM